MSALFLIVGAAVAALSVAAFFVIRRFGLRGPLLSQAETGPLQLSTVQAAPLLSVVAVRATSPHQDSEAAAASSGRLAHRPSASGAGPLASAEQASRATLNAPRTGAGVAKGPANSATYSARLQPAALHIQSQSLATSCASPTRSCSSTVNSSEVQRVLVGDVLPMPASLPKIKVRS